MGGTKESRMAEKRWSWLAPVLETVGLHLPVVAVGLAAGLVLAAFLLSARLGLRELPSSWAAVLGALAGGGPILIADWLRHLRVRKERVQDHLLTKRVEAYASIWEALDTLRERVGPVKLKGVEHLRHPKGKRVSPESFEDSSAVSEAKGLDEHLFSLPRLVSSYAMFVAPGVTLAFREGYPEFMAWVSRVRRVSDRDLGEKLPGYEDELQASLERLVQSTLLAVTKDLGVPTFGPPAPGAVLQAEQQGWQRARETMTRLERQNDSTTEGG